MSTRVRALLLLVALSAALSAALYAQALLQSSRARGFGLVATAFGLALFAGRLLPGPAARAPAPAPSLRPTRAGWLVIGAAALALLVMLQRFDAAPVLQLAALVGSLLSWLAAYLPRELRFGQAPRALLVTRLSLFGCALFVCFYALDRIPGGLFGDEGSLGLVVKSLLDGTKSVAPFALGWAQLPNLFTWIEAAGVQLLGDDIGALRATAAIGGALCVLPWFGLLRRELGLVPAAGAALILLASPAHQHLSRMALPESWIRPCAFSALFALYFALRSGRASAYVASGIALGCCFYMGSKAVLLPPIMLASALFSIAATLPGSLAQRNGIVLTSAAALLTFLPELAYYAHVGWRDVLVGHHGRWMDTSYPGDVFAHAERVVRLLFDAPEVSPFSPFDDACRVVSEVEGSLMVVGLGIAVARPRRPIAAFLIGWLAGGLASLWLDSAPNQVPHAILISCLPAAFAAFALHGLQEAGASLARRPAVGALLAAACAVVLGLDSASSYFRRGPGSAPWAASEITALGKAMQEYRDRYHVALVTPEMSWDLNTTLLYLAPEFHAPSKFTQLDPRKPWFGELERDVAFLVQPRLVPLLPVIRARYPRAPVELRKNSSGVPILAVVRVSADEVRRVEAQLRDRDPGPRVSL